MTDSIICERHGAVLLVTLNRPKANALTLQMILAYVSLLSPAVASVFLVLVGI